MDEVNEMYADLKESVCAAFSESEVEIIEKAFEFACTSHNGQLRKSGEPYIIHPIAVAKILIDFGMDYQSIVAALLHDVVEDTPVTSEDIRRLFGAQVQILVDGVTKLGKVPLQNKEEQQAENLRKLLLAMSEDIRVIIIKLADRLHNMRTLKYVEEQKRRDTAKETIEIYAPIAHRLGIRPVKEELEDLAISYLDPIAYKEIEDALAEQEPLRKEFLENIKDKIAARIKSVVSESVVQGRIKSVHGIYRKMYIQGKSFEEIYDIYAVRIIVKTVSDCYNCLGVIHDMYKPIQGRFKDYISTPKPNMYQSLHTTLIGKEGIPFEVQIRTEEMHKTAEYGIAAHWKYKLGYKDKDADKKLEKGIGWVKHLLEAQSETDGDATDLLDTIKHDFVSDEVYVFTPKGDVICLPVGATVIDFAYAIHSAVGNKMTGAKVDKRIVQLNYQVKTGEIIEILTSSQQGKGPSRDWLKIVTTNEAKAKIRSWFKKERREENIEEGRNEYESQLRRNNMTLTDEQSVQLLEVITEKQKFTSFDDFFAALGYGGIVLSKLMPMIKDEYNKIVKTSAETAVKYKQAKTVSSEGVVVEGISNCLIKLSRCCNPIPGDDIIGFITRGHGVSVHKRDCPNVPEDIYNCAESHRWIKVYWNSTVKSEFSASMLLTCLAGKPVMNDIFTALNAIHVTVQSINTRGTKDGRVLVNLTIAANSVEHLKTVMARLGKLSGVLSVDRSGADI